MASTYYIESHDLSRFLQQDIVVADTDLDALRQARRRCSSGALFRYAYPLQSDRRLWSFRFIYVAHFFKWEVR